MRTKRFALALGLALAVSGVAYALSYGVVVNYTTPNNSPRWVATGSLRGNGILDLLVIGDSAPSLSVFLGVGDGTFGPKTDTNIGTELTTVILADLRQNGKLDAVVTDYGGNFMDVMLGKGDGTFAAPVAYGSGSHPIGVAAGSMRNNGITDLVVANAASNNVFVYLGVGDGTFGAGSNYTTGAGPETVALGDVNGDGNLDVVVCNTLATTVSVLLGNGTGALGAKTDISVGSAPGQGVAVADLRNVGKLDIVCVTPAAGSPGVAVLLGNGNGTFAAAVQYATGANPQSVVIGDVDGDGKLDLVTRNYGTAYGVVILGNGNGTFGTPHTIGTTGAVDPSCICLGDFNGDGKLDLAASCYSGGAVGLAVLLQTTSDTRGECPAIGGNALPLWANTKAQTSEFRSGSTGKTIKGE